jgi:hypothetical protein
VLGNIMRYVVHLKGLKLTVDALNTNDRNGMALGMTVKLRLSAEECKELIDGGV